MCLNGKDIEVIKQESVDLEAFKERVRVVLKQREEEAAWPIERKIEEVEKLMGET